MEQAVKIRSLFCILVIVLLSACQPSKLLALATSTPTSTATNTLTPVPTFTPTITPTPIGGGNGTILYSEGWTLYSIGTNGRNKKLIDENCSWNITFSPDGHYATCSMGKQIDDKSWGGYGVTLIDLQTHKVVKKLAESALVGQTPTSRLFGEDPTMVGWSPNSKQYVFIGTYQDETGLYVIDIDTSSVTLLFKSQDLRDIKWSPEGTKILLFELAKNSGWKLNLYVVNLDGTHVAKLTEKPVYFEAILSEWGNDDNTVFLNFQGMKGINLETMQPNGETLPFINPSPMYIPSPNRQYQLIVGSSSNREVFLENIGDSQKTDLSKDFNIPNSIGSSLPDIQWSPDSKMLGYYDAQSASIVLISIETLSIFSKIKVEQDSNSQQPYYYGKFTWLPDGKQLLFVQADKSGGFAIMLSDLDGNAKMLFNAKYPVGIHVDQLTH